MSSNPPVPPTSSAPSELTLDLSAEARQFVRKRLVTAGLGAGFGVVFVGIGSVEVTSLGGSFPGPASVVALLLIALGIGLIVLSLNSGLLNPARRLEANSRGVTITRRWGRPVAVEWTDPAFYLEVEDLTADPATSPEEKRHLFFSGPGPAYGSLASSSLGPVLDAVRAHGLSVRMRTADVRSGLTRHRIRRLRIARPK